MMKFVILLVAWVGMVSHVAQGFLPTICPSTTSGWFAYEGRCFYYSGHNIKRTWNDADQVCQNLGGRLASIHTRDENDMAHSKFAVSSRSEMWIGLYQVQGMNTYNFAQLDGTPFVYSQWAPGEPNDYSGFRNGEDCCHMWNRAGQGNWNDEPCYRSKTFMCSVNALCPAGSYERVAYARWRGVKADCQYCPAGSYRTSAGGFGQESCSACPPGRMGLAGSTSARCTSTCPQGYYCPESTSQSAAIDSANGRKSCPPGTYGPRAGLGSASDCLPCEPGYYCGLAETRPDPPTQKCANGRCGFLAQSTSQCNQKCPAGYTCPAGTACPSAERADGSTPNNIATPCGGNNVYCPSGSSVPKAVSAGYYTTGGTATTRTGEAICEPGYYCIDGVRNPCPGGTYTAEVGANSNAACQPCDAGYVCPDGSPSTSPRAMNCYDVDYLQSLGGYGSVIGNPEMVYCPRGSVTPRIVSNGYYTAPRSNVYRVNRERQIPCNDAQVCDKGIRYNLLSWSSGNGCSSSSKDSFEVLEMTPMSSNPLKTYTAAINQFANANDYTLSYFIASFDYFDSTVTACRPTDLTKNKDIFTYNSANGRFGLSRNDLDYEVCLPVVDVRYTAVIRARATRKQDNKAVATISCTLDILIDDDNDKPEFYDFDVLEGGNTKVYHRQIMEKVDKNVPVAICDAYGAPNCPLNTLATEQEPRLLAKDQDDGSVLRYSIISGDDGFDNNIAQRLFKIDSCTGLVSAKYSNRISFRTKNTYRYEVKIEDDGNGGRYAPKTDFAVLYIHVIDVNDPPVLDDSAVFTIRENRGENQVVGGGSLINQATDEDTGDTLTFQLATNDGDAFKIVNNQLMTTRVGAETINFESSKLTYFLDIEVQDGRGGFATGTFQVNVLNTNDAPKFVGKTAFYVKENLSSRFVCETPEADCASGAGVATIDEDGDPPKYSIAANPYFSIHPSTGVISTKTALNFEDESLNLQSGTGRGYIVQVTATSLGITGDNTPKSTSTMVTIYIVDVNEPPTLDGTVDSFQVLESWPIGYSIPGVIEGDDPDNSDKILLGEFAPQQSLTYSNDGPNEYFSVQTNPTTNLGELVVVKQLNYESFQSIQVKVKVTDNGSGERGVATKTFTVNIVDANEPPRFSSLRYVDTAPENVVYTGPYISAIDPDGKDDGTLDYSIVGGSGIPLFDIEELNGDFRVVQRSTILGGDGSDTGNPVVLNYELSNKQWNLDVMVKDSGPSSMIAAACEVTDLTSCGDGAICTNGRCKEKCFDTNRRQASLVGHDNLFRCDYWSNETKQNTINTVPTDPFVETSEITIVLKIVDQNDPPVVDCSGKYFIISNIQGRDQDVTKVNLLGSKTTDDDTMNINSPFLFEPYTYSLANSETFLQIVDGNTKGAYIQYIGGQNNGLGGVGAVYTPTLIVQDSSGASSQCQLTIEVIFANTAPTIDDINNLPSIPENTLPGDTEYVVVASIPVTDGDDNEVFTFTTSPNPFFELDSATGKITLGDSSLDYESLPNGVYTLIVQVKDKAGAEDVAEITIPVTDVNESPVWSGIQPVSILENETGVNVEILDASLFASDEDTKAQWNTLTFSLVECVDAETTGCPFQVAGSTGKVSLTSSLDYESINQFTVVLSVTDGEFTAQTQFELNVLDVNEPPVFTESNPTVPVVEGDLNQDVNLFDMTRVVVDEDANDTPQNMKYSITDGNDDSLFRIEGGILKVNNDFLLDYEKQDEYTLTIRAEDTGGLFATNAVVIKVQNLNDVRITGIVPSTPTLACGGSTLVTITGKNFGFLSDAKLVDTTFTVKYKSSTTGVEYDCGNVNRINANDNTVLTCEASPGVGRGFSWTVAVTVSNTDIDNDVSPSFVSATIGYDRPQITNVANTVDLTTSGGSDVVISGSCIGASSDHPSGFAGSARYCNSVGTCYTPSDCTISGDDQLTCTTVPGLGGDLRWIVSVFGGLVSDGFESGNYAPPRIDSTSVSVIRSTGVLDTPLILSGGEFGALGSSPSKAELLYLDDSDDPIISKAYRLTSCVVTQSFQEITCQGAAPGMGKDLYIMIEFAGQMSGTNNTVTISYAVPIITGFTGEGVKDASTAGGQQILIQGSGFGPACGEAASENNNDQGVQCPLLRTSYSRGSRRVSDGTLIVYKPTCIIVGQNQMICQTVAGTGEDHRWTFNFAGHIFTFNKATTSYAQPTVGNYLGAGSNDALTTGGQEVVLIGSNYGPIDGAPVYAYYGREDKPKEFGPVQCVVTLANEKVRCETLIGAGDELKWTLYVDDQESKAETTNYAEPSIYSLSQGVFDVDGGEIVAINGLNFGPAFPSYLESVRYGPASNPNAYEPSCYVDGHERILCTTVPGIGASLRFRVQVKGQVSDLTNPVRANYEPANLLELSSVSGPTDGGKKIRIRGIGIPVCDKQTNIIIKFGSKKISFDNVFDETVSTTVPISTTLDCPLASSSRALEFALPEMTDTSSQDVELNFESKLFPEVIKTNALRFVYDAPVLKTVYAEPVGGDNGSPNCQGDFRVTLRGDNFCASSACCQVVLNGRESSYASEQHSHHFISFCTSETGFVYVKCGDSISQTLQFNAESPYIFQTTTTQGLPLKSIQYPTNVGDIRNDTITLWGLYFGLATPSVKIGDIEATILSHGEIACDDPTIPPNTFGSLSTLDVSCWKTDVKVPSGQGKDNAITVTAGGSDQSSLANSDFEFVHYKPPVIDSIQGLQKFSTEGGDTITIVGSDFGLSGEVHLYAVVVNGIFGVTYNLVGNITVDTWGHEQITCTIPMGEGQGLLFRVVSGNQDTRAQQEFTLDYQNPIVSEVTKVGAGRTIGGDSITIVGENFGRPYSGSCASMLETDCTPVEPKVLLGGLECVLTGNTQTTITCIVPEGEGKDLAVVVIIRDQVANTGTTFDYAAPIVTSYTPQVANTDGLDENDIPEVMTIYGDNFGNKDLQVLFRLEGVEYVVADRSRNSFIVNQAGHTTNHTVISFLVPVFRGMDIAIIVDVAGQRTEITDPLFRYRKPTVVGITTKDEDGNIKEWSGGSTDRIDDEVFGEFVVSSRRVLQALPDILKMELGATATTAPICERSTKYKGFSWFVTTHNIYNSDYFEKEVTLFGDAVCGSPLVSISTTGEYKTVKTTDQLMACSNIYMQDLYSVEVTPVSEAGRVFLIKGGQPIEPFNSCCTRDWQYNSTKDITSCIESSGCTVLSNIKPLIQTGVSYGLYMLAERTKLFQSEPVDGISALYETPVHIFSDRPNAVMMNSLSILNNPSGPTSACFEWESYRSYIDRRRDAIRTLGTAINVYRECNKKALMTLSGENFSEDLFNTTNQIKIYFVSEADNSTIFEAATTTSKGDHPEVCSLQDGCIHDNDEVTFHIPPGYGSNLLIQIQVGNQNATAVNETTGLPIYFHYDVPRVDESKPGSIFADYSFKNADGQETIELYGDNFGGVSSPASIMIDGRACKNATWVSGDEDIEGFPFLRCTSERELVGVKNLFVCIAEQLSYVPSFKDADTLLLLEADRVDTGNANTDRLRINALYDNVASVMSSRCKTTYDIFGNAVGTYGGINQLCAPCPEGSICNEPDAPFTPPKAEKFFYRLDVKIFDENNQVTERAGRRCDQSRTDLSLLDAYPGLVLEETCPDYVACEPLESCLGGNTCAPGYQYTFQECNKKRETMNNTCRVQFDPYTGGYVGVQTDCNPNPGQACSPQNPEQCSTCEVVYDSALAEPYGVCTCSMPQRCSLCSVFTHRRAYGECKECPKKPWLVVLMFVLLVIGSVLVGWYMNKKKVNLALVAIGIDYFQVLAVFGSTNIDWPAGIQALFEALNFINFNIDVVPVECISPEFEFETKWWLSEMLPFGILSMLIMVHLGYTAFKMIFRRNKRVKLTSHVARLVSVFLALFYVLYLNLSRQSLNIFNCNPLPVDDGYKYTSFTSLSCDGGGVCRCGEEGGIQQRLVPLAAIFLVLYTIGFPVFVYFAIRKNKDLIIEDQYLRAHGIGDSRETNVRAYDTRKKYSMLYMHFKPIRQYWVVLIIIRKALIAAAALLFRGNPTFQMAMILLVLFWSFVIHMLRRPYMSTGERAPVLKELDDLAERGLDQEEFYQYADLQRKIQEQVKTSMEIERRNKQRIGAREMWGDRGKVTEKMAQKQDLKRRAAMFFSDFNTVEGVLLASAILVCLAGIMFESGRFNGREDIRYQQEFLTYLLIIIVICSIVYYLLVFLAEIFPSLSVLCFLRIIQRRKPEDHEVLDLDADVEFDDNPMFQSGFQPKNTRLKKELEENNKKVDDLAEQNEILRKELQQAKQDSQMKDSFEMFGVASPLFSGAGGKKGKKKQFQGGKGNDAKVDTE